MEAGTANAAAGRDLRRTGPPAAAVLSVVGTSVVLSNLDGRPDGGSAAGRAALASVPPFFVYLNGFSGTGETTEAIVRSSATGHITVRTGQLLRILDSRLLTAKNDSFGNVLWVGSDGRSMVALLPPHGPGKRAGGQIQPVLGVLTGNPFTPMPFAYPAANEFAW